MSLTIHLAVVIAGSVAVFFGVSWLLDRLAPRDAGEVFGDG